MPTAKCTPGQDGVPAFPNAPVILEPETGDFGDVKRDVRLYSNNVPRYEDMTVDDWKPERIRALIPGTSPGDGRDGETFKVVIDANGGYESNPVDVLGPTGGYPLPPTHLAAKCTPGQDGVPAFANAPVILEPETGDFGDEPGGVRLYSENVSGYADMTVTDWEPQRINAIIPGTNPGSGAVDETFRVVIDAKEGYQSSNVVVLGPGGGYALPPTDLTLGWKPDLEEASDKASD